MRLTIFGATGRTGGHLLEQALEAGHDVTVLVRDPEKVKTESRNLLMLAGDVQDLSKVEAAIANSECVISVLGPKENKPIFAISAGTKNIITVMKKQGIRRLIITTGAGVADPNDAPGLFNHFMNFLVKRVSGYVFEDMRETVAMVRASGLDWTIVRVPRLTDGAPSGKIRTGYVGKGTGAWLCRADLAGFVLRQASDNTYLNQAPVISN